MMNRQPCPCGCGRRIPLSDAQIRDITIVNRSRYELDVADAYGCAISTVRHLRSLPTAQLQRPA
jgi:hypothetical protein